MKTQAEILDGLKNFYGTENYYKYRLFNIEIVLTDGVKWLCENAGCYWLMDAILSYQKKCRKDDMLKGMQFWKLTVKDKSAVLICERDKDNVAIQQKIEYTDFPLQEISIWVQNGVALLPSEY